MIICVGVNKYAKVYIPTYFTKGFGAGFFFNTFDNKILNSAIRGLILSPIIYYRFY